MWHFLNHLIGGFVRHIFSLHISLLTDFSQQINYKKKGGGEGGWVGGRGGGGRISTLTELTAELSVRATRPI